MGAQLGTKGAMDQPNFTPLIDVVLVILIIMMVNIPIQIEEMGVKLPDNRQVQNTQDVPLEQLVIAIYEDGTVALNRRLMTDDVMFYEVTRRLRPMEKKNVFIDAAPGAPYGRVVDMIDTARGAGASKVGLARLKEAGPLPATEVAPGSMPRGVTVGLPTVVGFLSQRQADEGLKEVLPKIEGCYEAALRRKMDLSGRYSVKLSIGPDGKQLDPPEAQTTNMSDDPDLGPCIEQMAKDIHFDPLGAPDRTAAISYPLLFSPG